MLDAPDLAAGLLDEMAGITTHGGREEQTNQQFVALTGRRRIINRRQSAALQTVV